jgi:hypothetical protein
VTLNPTARTGRRLAAGVALACSGVLLPATAFASSAASGTPAHPAAAVLPAVGSATGAATHPQQRQLAVTTLSSFKVVLTATRSPGTAPAPMATVTAAGYRPTSGGWKLITTQRIGKASGWFWYSTAVCSLTVTQLKPEPSSAAPSDTITVSLLETPALGCSGPYTKSWRP